MSSCLFRGGIKSRANSITVQMSHWDPLTSDVQTVAPCVAMAHHFRGASSDSVIWGKK